jgi:hypothetical protein
MPNTKPPALPNMQYVQMTWDALLTVTTSPLLDFTGKVSMSIPVAGIIFSLERGVVSGVLQYEGDPNQEDASWKAVGCTVTQFTASIIESAIVVAFPPAAGPMLYIAPGVS